MEKALPPSYDEASKHPPGFVPNVQSGYNPNMQPGYNPNMQPGYNPNMPPGFVPPPNQPQPYPVPLNQQQVVMVTSPPITLGPNSQPMTCPHCHHQITTRVESESSSRTHLFAVLLCIVGCIPCCLIPYCMDSCQNRNHYCPNCGAFVGAYTNQ